MDEEPFTVDDIGHAVSGDTSLLSELSKWERWSSSSAKAARKEHGWIEGLRGKAERLIFAPIMEQYRNDSEGLDLAALGRAAIDLQPSIHSEAPEFEYGLSALGASLCYRPPMDMQMVQRVFPDRGAFSEGNTSEADADPYNFLKFVLDQIGWHAAREGWAICIAEDELATGDGIFSWVDPMYIPPLPEPGRVVLPGALGVKGWGDLDKKLGGEVGADRLWFVLTRELAALPANTSSKAGPKRHGEKHRERRAATALFELFGTDPGARLTRTDAFEALQAEGFSRKAAGRIWDHGAPEKWKVGGALRHDVRRFHSDDLITILRRIV